MARYRVCFEGKWQAEFDAIENALEWGREVGDTGRLVHVARFGAFRTELIAIFPKDRFAEGERLWWARMKGSGVGGG